MIGNGKRIADLYIIDAASIDLAQNVCISSKNVGNSVYSIANNVITHIWHHKLGHLSVKRLDMLKDQLHFKCNGHKNNLSIPFSICPLAIQRRLSFISNNHLSPNAFDLVHCDKWGPYHVPTHVGYRYFLTLMGDYTRFTWIDLMKQNSDINSIILKIFILVETQFHEVIKKFRFDNALKLLRFKSCHSILMCRKT